MKLLNKQAKSPRDTKFVLLDIDYTIFNTAKFKESNLKTYTVYEEVIPALAEMKKLAHIGIFSEGDLGFQEEKLIKTDIKKYLLKEHIHIALDKQKILRKILSKYKVSGKLYLVDDKLPILFLAKKYSPKIITIWVKRGVYAESQLPIQGFQPDAEVDSLMDIIPLLAKD